MVGVAGDREITCKCLRKLVFWRNWHFKYKRWKKGNKRRLTNTYQMSENVCGRTFVPLPETFRRHFLETDMAAVSDICNVTSRGVKAPLIRPTSSQLERTRMRGAVPRDVTGTVPLRDSARNRVDDRAGRRRRWRDPEGED